MDSPSHHIEVQTALQPLVSAETNQKLIQIPTSLEIKEAMYSIHVEKAPRPNVFSASFL